MPWNSGKKEYIDAVTKANQAKNKGKTVDCSYEEGYDSSRWIEITLPDGKKYYVPKEAVGNRSGKGKNKTNIRLIMKLAGMKWSIILRNIAFQNNSCRTGIILRK